MRRPGALVLALLLAGCGGGGGSRAAVPAAPKSGLASGQGNVKFAINIPAASTTQSKARTPKFVSPATKSVSIAVAGTTTNINVVSGSPGCNTDYTQDTYVETPVNLQPRGILQGPDGNMWFNEDAGGSVGRMAPGLVYTDFGTGWLQNDIILGPNGQFWVTIPFSAAIGMMTTSGSGSELFGYAADMQNLAEAADNTVWATAYTEAPQNTVYHIAADGTFLSGDTITTMAGSSTFWPALGPDGAIYVTENNGTSGWIARIQKIGVTWTLTNEFPMPGAVDAITSGPDGALWTGDTSGNVYRVTTGGTVTNTYHTSGFAENMIAGPDGAIWLAEFGANKIGRLTTTGTLNEFAVNDSPYGVAFGSDGVYFTEETMAKIGRLNFPVACTATASIPAGTASATLTAYDAVGGAGGSGNKLSTQTLPVTIAANSTNIVNFVLNGIVKSLVLTPTATPPGCTTSGSIPIAAQALDASGNAIIGPGNYSDAAGNALTFALTTDDGSGNSTFTNGVITSPSTAPAWNWNGGFINNQTITATVSGGTIAGTISSFQEYNNCG